MSEAVMEALAEASGAAGKRRQKRRERLLVLSLQLLVLVVIFGGWELLARIGVVNTFFWSKPSAILATATKSFGQGTLTYDTFYTMEATVAGFVISTLVGSFLGLMLWWSHLAARVFEPYIVVFHAMPKLALAPLVVLVFGIGLVSKISMAVALTIVVALLTAYSGVKAIDQDLVLLLDSLGATRRQVFLKVVVPSTLPWIISTLRINIGLALAGAIVGELISSQHGLGRVIIYAASIYDISLIWVAVLTLSLLAILMYVGVAQIERWLLKGLVRTPNA